VWKVKLPSFDEVTSTRFLCCPCDIRIVCTDTSFAALLRSQQNWLK